MGNARTGVREGGVRRHRWTAGEAPALLVAALAPGLLEVRDIHQVLADADTRTQLLSRGLEPAATTPEEFARHIRSEIERWSKVIRESGVRAEQRLINSSSPASPFVSRPRLEL